MSVKIYVGNLPQKLTRSELLDHFATIEILKVDFGVDREGRFNGYCYLIVKDEMTADLTCNEYNHKELFGRCLRVTKCLQRHATEVCKDYLEVILA